MDLKVKTRNDKQTKFSPPCRQDRMIHDIHRCQVAEHLESIEVSQHILPYDETDIYNEYITKEPDYMNCFCNQLSSPLCSRTRSFGFRSTRRFWFMEGSCITNQETKECRPTQIKTEENNKQNDNRFAMAFSL